MKTLTALAAVALIAMPWVASAVPKRDEAKASHYLYCAALNSYWVFALGNSQTGSNEITARQNASNEFLQAATLLSDESFFPAHKSDSVQQVRAVLDASEHDQGAGLARADAECANARRDEVIPLLKAEKFIPGDGFETTVPVHQVSAITRDIVQWHAEQHPDCPFEKVSGAKIIKRDKESTTEHWTVEACGGKQFAYRVFLIPQDGGITDAIGNVEAPAEEHPRP